MGHPGQSNTEPCSGPWGTGCPLDHQSSGVKRSTTWAPHHSTRSSPTDLQTRVSLWAALQCQGEARPSLRQERVLRSLTLPGPPSLGLTDLSKFVGTPDLQLGSKGRVVSCTLLPSFMRPDNLFFNGEFSDRQSRQDRTMNPHAPITESPKRPWPVLLRPPCTHSLPTPCISYFEAVIILFSDRGSLTRASIFTLCPRLRGRPGPSCLLSPCPPPPPRRFPAQPRCLPFPLFSQVMCGQNMDREYKFYFPQKFICTWFLIFKACEFGKKEI